MGELWGDDITSTHHNFHITLLFPPPPPSNVQGGLMRIPIFSEKGVFSFGRLSREDFSEKNL